MSSYVCKTRRYFPECSLRLWFFSFFFSKFFLPPKWLFIWEYLRPVTGLVKFIVKKRLKTNWLGSHWAEDSIKWVRYLTNHRHVKGNLLELDGFFRVYYYDDDDFYSYMSKKSSNPKTVGLACLVIRKYFRSDFFLPLIAIPILKRFEWYQSFTVDAG